MSDTPKAPAGLDFEAIRLSYDEYTTASSSFLRLLRDYPNSATPFFNEVNRQHAALLAAAVEQARAEERQLAEGQREIQRQLYEAKYAPLVAALWEWQEARKADRELPNNAPSGEYARRRGKLAKAEDALAALPLPEVTP